jgi:hypothetical protein
MQPTSQCQFTPQVWKVIKYPKTADYLFETLTEFKLCSRFSKGCSMQPTSQCHSSNKSFQPNSVSFLNESIIIIIVVVVAAAVEDKTLACYVIPKKDKLRLCPCFC